jgi:hypothetical protein
MSRHSFSDGTLTQRRELSAKEIPLDLDDLTPRPPTISRSRISPSRCTTAWRASASDPARETAAAIESELQQRLDAKDPGAFTVSRVVIRALNTDPSIEESIRTAVQNQKRLEAKKIEVDIAAKDAEIEIARARGIAEANRIINASLTAEYLQHEINKALHEFAEHDNSVVVIPANMQGFELILEGKSMQRPRASTQ